MAANGTSEVIETCSRIKTESLVDVRAERRSHSSAAARVRPLSVSRGTETFRVRAVDNNGFGDLSPAVLNWTR
jgi:hypothetical protein